MQELMQKHYEQLARATITQLRRRGFEAEWFATAEEAKAAALREELSRGSGTVTD